MPNQTQHISQWKRNRQLLLSNALSDYPEWVITVAFYCALHAVEALLIAKGLGQTKDHASRNRLLGDPGNKLLKIWHPYKALFDASHDARYACPAALVRFSAGVQKELIQIRLQQVEQEVIKHAGLDRGEFCVLDVDSGTGRIDQRGEPQGSSQI